MAMIRATSSQWPTLGERHTPATLYYAAFTTDAIGGQSDPRWTVFGKWWVKSVSVPFIVNEQENAILYQLEGEYRRDLVDRFNAGTGVRIRANRMMLTVLQIDNPLQANRTLIAHCGKAINA